MPNERIIAVGLLTAHDVSLLGATFERLWSVEDTLCFSQLLVAIDDADRELKRRAEPQQATDRSPQMR
jgi:hypothetical protein